jgi:TetR/AcrR family transcriptional regulator, transcriptional repressor for nem operon
MPRPKEFDHSQVVKRAMDVFWQKGYEATSISDLTEATALKPGSLYNTFGSKHAIYLQALDYYITNIGRQVFTVLDETLPGRLAIERCFSDLIDIELSDPLERGCFMQNAIMERATCDKDVYERACLGEVQGIAAFRRALTRAQSAGQVRQNLEIDDVARYLVAMVYAVRTMARISRNRSDLEAVVRVALSALT